MTEGRGNTFEVHGENVAVFRVEGGIYATSDACRHEDGPVGEGDLDGKIVTCPYHDWKYDVTTGDCITEPSRPLPCFAVTEHDGFMFYMTALTGGHPPLGVINNFIHSPEYINRLADLGCAFP